MQAPRNIIELFKIPWVRIVLEALGIVAALWVLHALSAVLTPVLIGLVLAYMVDPLVTWVAKHRVPRSWAVGAVFGGGALLIAGVALAFMTPVYWGSGWLWTSLVLLIGLTGWMFSLGQRTYHPLRRMLGMVWLIQGKPQPVEPQRPIAEITAHIAKTRPREMLIAGVGGFALILWLMVVKPF